MADVMRGLFVDYALAAPPLAIAFDFNPQSLRRTRTIAVNTPQSPATRGGYDFALPTETPRAAQGVSMEAERFSLTILLDATATTYLSSVSVIGGAYYKHPDEVLE